MVWSRPNGPPKVWNTVEIVKSDGETIQFTIEEIPVDRYDEVVEHMCSIFIQDEAMCSSMNVIDDPTSLELLRAFWKKIVAEGITIAAFVKSENEKPIIAGINVLSVSDKDSDKEIKPILSSMSKAEKIITFAINSSTEANPCERYGVDAYLGAVGLSVDPRYRRLGLGQRLLEARHKIGEAYGIAVTSTLFTSSASQATAAKAGYKVHMERLYDEIIDEKGDVVFPNLKGKIYKMMEKKLF
ncbi:uncharacterized protein [Chelonus insularis]|nr:uncharacterized protein LOC118071176 isoform X2 [Chelonus insularis]